jgi:hypothetical protein
LSLREKLEAIGCDPGLGLAKIAEDPKEDRASRLQAYSTLMPYVYPRRKPVDDSNGERDAGGAPAITKQEALEFARDLIALFSPEAAHTGKLPASVSESEPKPSVGGAADED